MLASGSDIEINGNSTVTFEQVITVTDELRDNPSSLHLSVTRELENGVMVEKNPKEYEYRFGIDKILGIVNAKALNEVCSPEYIAREAWLKKETEALIMQEKSGILRMLPKTMGCLSEPWKL